jgi:hypothetical protein
MVPDKICDENTTMDNLEKELDDLMERNSDLLELKSLSTSEILDLHPGPNGLGRLCDQTISFLKDMEEIISMKNVGPELREKFREEIRAEIRLKEGEGSSADVEKLVLGLIDDIE